jgi:hypothetical protein
MEVAHVIVNVNSNIHTACYKYVHESTLLGDNTIKNINYNYYIYNLNNII